MAPKKFKNKYKNKNRQNRQVPVRNRPAEENLVERVLHLPNLEDKCLKKICSFLELDELANLARAYPRLISFCSDRFLELYDQNHYDFSIHIYELNNPRKRQVYRNMLELFGNYIKKLRIEYDSNNQFENKEIHSMMLQYASATLVEIHFIDLKKGMQIDRVFPNLQIVTFSSCYLSASTTAFKKWFPELRKVDFEMINSVDSTGSIERSFPRLQHFGVVNFLESNFTNKNVQRFIERNPQLKGLRIARDTLGLFMDISNKLLSYFDQMLPDLELLDITFMHAPRDWPPAFNPATFSNLKSLRMVCQNATTLPVSMSVVTTLEHLNFNIADGADENILNHIWSCPNLKSLTWFINTSSETRKLFQLSLNPRNPLQDVKLYSSFGSNEDCYHRSMSLISVTEFMIRYPEMKSIVVGFAKTDNNSTDMALSNFLGYYCRYIKIKFDGEWSVTYHLQRIISRYAPLTEVLFICAHFKKLYI